MVAARHLQSGTGDPEVRVTLLQQTTALHLYRRALRAPMLQRWRLKSTAEKSGTNQGLPMLSSSERSPFFGGERAREPFLSFGASSSDDPA